MKRTDEMDREKEYTIGVTACSDGQPEQERERNERLFARLEEMGVRVNVSPFLYCKASDRRRYIAGTGEERGRALMDLFRDGEVKAIYDISGGDAANEVLEYLDFELIAENEKLISGYSDLTAVLNGIHAKTGIKTCLFQLKNLVYDKEGLQAERFFRMQNGDRRWLFSFRYDFIQGNSMEGEVIGGNIRCFLKLAGTPYMPDFKDKILFLESLGGSVPQIVSYISQLKQMGAFHKVRGVLLGTFTQMEEEGIIPDVPELLLSIIGNQELPVAKTFDIGHGSQSKTLVIGGSICLTKERGEYFPE